MDKMQLKSIVEAMDCDQARFANKALDFYDGNQLTHMCRLLDDAAQGRKNWKQRGMRASYRNITQSIIDKSAMLFINGRPQITVEDVNSGELIEQDTMIINQLLDDSMFDEFLANFDGVLRLLKTALMLVQYDNTYQSLTFDILHKGNCYVQTQGPKRDISLLCYVVSTQSDGAVYRVIDQFEVSDWFYPYDTDKEIINISTVPNPYGMIPAAVFHDTKVPRDKFWNYIPQDLVLFNEEYNLYLTDTLFAASFANRKTLFTNTNLDGNSPNSMEVTQQYGSKLPTIYATGNTVIMGPDKIVQIDTTGVENPYLEYKGPDIAIQEIHDMFSQLTKDVASDWCVRIKVEGAGSATSGFQVVVEEMDNLELRKQRQKNYEGGLSRLYYIASNMINIAEASNVLQPDSYVCVEFKKPSLPVEDDKVDQLWITRIDNNLASRVDYIMDKYNVSRNEALDMLVQIDQDNANTSVKTTVDREIIVDSQMEQPVIDTTLDD